MHKQLCDTTLKIYVCQIIGLLTGVVTIKGWDYISKTK